LLFAGSTYEEVASEHGFEDEFTTSDVLMTLFDRNGRERIVAGPPRPPGGEWCGIGLHAAAPHRVYAVLSLTTMGFPRPRAIEAGAPALLTPLFVFDGATWRKLPPPPSAPHLGIGWLCTTADGSLWVAGKVITADSSGTVTDEQAYVARLRDGRWSVVTPPAPQEPHVAWETPKIACGGDDVWVGGEAIEKPERVRSWLGDELPLLYHYEAGSWQRVVLPEPPPPSDPEEDRLNLGVLQLDRDGRPWITYWRPDDETTQPTYSYDGAGWTVHPLPEIPSVGHYALEGLVFDHEGVGWAIANRHGNAVHPESHGFLLELHEGQWRLRNFTWPFWRHRWLGLFG